MYFIIAFYILGIGFFYRLIFGAYKRLALFHLFYLSYVVSIVLALPKLDNGQSYFNIYFVSVLLTPLLFMLGGLLGKIRIFPIINRKEHYLFFEFLWKRNNIKIAVFFVVFFIFYILDVGLSSSSFLFAISNPGDSIVAMEMRMTALSSNISPILTKLYGYSRAFLIPFLSSTFLILWLRGDIGRTTLLLVFSIALFYCAFSAAKAPVFYLILTMGLTYYWWQTQTNTRLAYIYLLKFSGVVIFGLLISSLFYPLLHGVGGGDAIAYSWEQLNERLFLVPSSVALKYFEVFGRSIDFLGWKGSSIVSTLLNEEYFSSAQFLYSYFYSNRFSDKGLMNAAFFASMYADFGFWGMVFGIIFCGFLVAQVQIFLDRIPFGAISLSCKGVCSLAVMQLPLTDFTSILIGRGMLLLPFLLCFFVYITCFISSRLR